MNGKCPRVLIIIVGLFFMLLGISEAANLKIEIDPSTGRPKVTSEVPVVSSTITRGWTVLSLSTGEKVAYFIDNAGNVSVQVMSGEVSVIVGNAVANLGQGEGVAVNINKNTGSAQIIATRGVVDVSAQGKRLRIKAGQQTMVGPNVPPATPMPAPSFPTPPALPVSAPAPTLTPPSAPPAPPKPPKYEVAPNVPAPPVSTQPEEYHGMPPASPAE